jgi:long-chain acyl-CoA synthetase
MATIAEHRPAERVWLKSYPAGVPAEADTGRYASVPQLLGESCRKFASLPAFTNMDATLDFATLDRLSRDFAAWLATEAGLSKGDRVAIMMPNLLQYPVALFGILRAGW